MPAAVAGPEIERLIQLLARLPGLGPRSARRAVLFLIKKREQIMAPLGAALQSALEKINVQRVPAQGEQFDPRVHEAIEVVESDQVPDHHVLEELQPGYRIKERLLRPAMVRVAKKPA